MFSFDFSKLFRSATWFTVWVEVSCYQHCATFKMRPFKKRTQLWAERGPERKRAPKLCNSTEGIVWGTVYQESWSPLTNLSWRCLPLSEWSSPNTPAWVNTNALNAPSGNLWNYSLHDLTFSLAGRGIASLLRGVATEKLRQDTREIRCGPEKEDCKIQFAQF